MFIRGKHCHHIFFTSEINQMKKILIIEDDTDITEILFLILGSVYEILIVNNCDGLLKKVIDFSPDLIICDNTIGQYKADEIISGIRSISIYKETPTLLLSAHPE